MSRMFFVIDEALLPALRHTLALFQAGLPQLWLAGDPVCANCSARRLA